MKKLGRKVLVMVALLFLVISVNKREVLASCSFPYVSTNSYLELIAFQKVNVYTSSSLSTRGTASPWKKYNASISNGDTIYVYTITSNYCYFSYPVGNIRKLGYCKTSDLLGLSQAKTSFISKSGCTVYKSSTGSRYGSVAKNDRIYTTVRINDRGFIIYTAKSGKRAWKAGWINLNDASKITPESTSSATTYYVKTSGPRYSLIMRRAASTTSTKVTTIPYGSAVSVYSITNNWAKVTYGGKSGYCSIAYLSKTKPTNNDSVISNSTTLAVQSRLNSIANGTLKYNSSTVLKVGSKFVGTRANEQCKGYAKNVFYLLFKVFPTTTQPKPYNYLLYSQTGMSRVGYVTSMNNNSIKTLFLKARPGDFVQMRRKHGGSHSAIVYSVTNDGVTFLEANLDNKNKIYKKYYPWSSLCSSNAAMSVYTATNYSLK